MEMGPLVLPSWSPPLLGFGPLQFNRALEEAVSLSPLHFPLPRPGAFLRPDKARRCRTVALKFFCDDSLILFSAIGDKD